MENTFVHMVGQMEWVISKGNEAKSKMKISYARVMIRTRVVVICSPMLYQLDHKGDEDNNYMFVVLLIHTLTQVYKLLVMSTIWPGIFFLWPLGW